MNCKKCRRWFVEAMADELNADENSAFQAHLDACLECAEAYAQLNATLRVMDQRQRTEPESHFWTGYWDRLAPKLEEADRPVKSSRRSWIPALPSLPGWAFQAAAATALLLIGLFIGKIAFQPSEMKKHPGIADQGGVTPEFAALQNRTDQYLERSKVLLLGFVNLDTDTEEAGSLNFQKQREISQNLIHEASYLKQDLSDHQAEQRLIRLIGDLEVILLQIANLEEENDLSAIEMVRSGVDKKGVLFKINMEEMRREEHPSLKPRVKDHRVESAT